MGMMLRRYHEKPDADQVEDKPQRRGKKPASA